MNETYYDVNSAASYGGVSSLARQFGTKTASAWLKFQDAYTLHKPKRKNFHDEKHSQKVSMIYSKPI